MNLDDAPSAWPANERTTTTAGPSSVTFVPDRSSVRGFFLGLLAVLLILAVLGLYVWSVWLDDATRNDISDLFGSIG